MVGARDGKMEEYDIVTLDNDNSTRYYKKGTEILHRLDGPALYAYNRTEWWVNDKLHRIGGPAVEWVSGSKEWYINGYPHRIDGPAIELKRIKEWHVNGKLHRVDGPAIQYANGDYIWMVNGKCHKLDGPAVDYDGTKEWWIDGKRMSPEKENIMNIWYENGNK